MTSQHHRQHLAFYALVAGAFAVLTIPRMAQTGMFLDGVIYAAIARNLSEGIGTFWFPSYTSILPVFHDHPPLAFGLQALAFAIVGDHVAVERVYSILMGGLVALLMVLIWRSTVRDSAYDWLPVVFWLVPAGVTWSVVNNMLENTQAVFTTLAVLAFVRSLDSARASYGWAYVAGLSVLGAVLTKGPVGLFPLAAPVILALVMRHHTVQALRSGAVMFGALVVGAALVIWPPVATWPPSCAVELLRSTSRRIRNWRQRAVGRPVDLVGATSWGRGHRADGCAPCVALALVIGPKVS